MPFETIRYEIADRILTITLNRPEQLNAFTVKMAEELIMAFEQASEDDAVDAIVVTGAGNAFCAGMDLSSKGNVFGLNESLKPDLEDMRSRLSDPEIEAGVRDTGGQLTLAIFECKKPVIAAVNGAAVGIGAPCSAPWIFDWSPTQPEWASFSIRSASHQKPAHPGFCRASSTWELRWSGFTAVT